jgi:DNA-binding NarL/FixJ family response regulator
MTTAAAPSQEGGTQAHRTPWDRPVSVLIIDDSCLHREALASVVRRMDWSGTVLTAADAEAGVRCVRTSRPDVVLLNVATLASMAMLGAVMAAAPQVRVVAVGITEAHDEVIACAEAGVAGYLLRSETLDDLTATVHSVLRGETRCSPRIAATLLRHVTTLASERHRPAELGPLTPRERQIVLLIDQGLTNKQIAESLCIEVPTVKNHVHNILEKLRVRRRGEAAARMRSARVPVSADSRDHRVWITRAQEPVPGQRTAR